MRILILGASGLLGNGLLNTLQKNNNHIVYGSVRHNNTSDDKIVPNIDISNLSKINQIIDDLNIECVINCIGVIKQKTEYSNIDFIRVNSIFPHQLAQICSLNHTQLIHISTDCVFDGARGNYTEGDEVGCDDIYSQTKFCGELYNKNNIITIRTSIIGRELTTKHGLVEWFLNQQPFTTIRGFKNAIYSGFPVITLAAILDNYVIGSDLSGLYHISAEPISKYDLLTLIADVFNTNVNIEPDYSVCCNRSLNCDKFKSVTGFKPNNWSSMVKDMHNNWK